MFGIPEIEVLVQRCPRRWGKQLVSNTTRRCRCLVRSRRRRWWKVVGTSEVWWRAWSCSWAWWGEFSKLDRLSRDSEKKNIIVVDHDTEMVGQEAPKMCTNAAHTQTRKTCACAPVGAQCYDYPNTRLSEKFDSLTPAFFIGSCAASQVTTRIRNQRFPTGSESIFSKSTSPDNLRFLMYSLTHHGLGMRCELGNTPTRFWAK